MRDRSVDRDDEINEGEDGGCIGEIVELRPDLHHAWLLRKQFAVSTTQLGLNREEVRRAGGPERSETGQRNRTMPIVHVLRTPGPGNRNLGPAQLLEARAPLLDARLIGSQISAGVRDRRGFGLKGKRQAAQRTVDIIGGKGVAPRADGAPALALAPPPLELP